ncbi:MAG: PilZ domain-containing protein [Thiogranum sp.]
MNSTASPAHSEQRRKSRVTIPEHPQILDAHSGQVLGELVNLSTEGLMAVSPECVTGGTVFQMRIPLVQGDRKVEILVGAESLWCDDANGSGTYWTGFQIIDISSEHQAILDAVVHS